MDLIPKTITDGGKTLTLADVQWANDGTYYTATAQYTGTASSRYATGYTVTADYTGEVSKTDCRMVTYTAIFGSIELEEPEPTPAPESTPAPETPVHVDGAAMKWPPLLGCAGAAAVLAVAALVAVTKIKERSVRK